jgi:hypothetical protein
VRRLALAILAGGAVDRVAAQEIHAMTAAAQKGAGGTYAPKALSVHEFATLERLTDLIVPVEDGRPGAVAAGAAAWIDMLASENARLKEIYTKGLTWLDAAMKERGAADFVSAAPADQTAMLDLIAYRKNRTPALEPGIEFFGWARRMTVDAFYTTEIGFKDIDYRGNTALPSYPPPADAIAYALKRSGLENPS